LREIGEWRDTLVTERPLSVTANTGAHREHERSPRTQYREGGFAADGVIVDGRPLGETTSRTPTYEDVQRAFDDHGIRTPIPLPFLARRPGCGCGWRQGYGERTGVWSRRAQLRLGAAPLDHELGAFGGAAMSAGRDGVPGAHASARRAFARERDGRQP